MADQIARSIDDARYQHHVKYRGRANHRIFWITWSVILIVLLLSGAWQISLWWSRRRQRHYEYTRLHQAIHTKFRTQSIAFVSAVSLLPLPGMAQLVFRRITLGQLVILTAMLMFTGYLTTNVGARTLSAQFFDDVAFRAAWLSLTQLPLVFLLSSKRGPINILAGLSYERLIWIHKWLARMLFVTVTTHVAIMKSSISMQDIVKLNDEGMTVVRRGVMAYGALLWIVLTSLLPLRRWSYRVFYVNHLMSTTTFLIVVIQHVPGYARSPIYLAIAFFATDKCVWIYHFCRNNISIIPIQGRLASVGRISGRVQLLMGYAVEMTAPPSSIAMLPHQTKDSSTIIRISKIPFSWRPGQHVRIYIPALGAFEMHPFTPANCSACPPPPLPPRRDIERSGNTSRRAPSPPAPTSEMLLTIRTHSSFTRRLAEYYKEWLTDPCPNASESPSTLTAYVDGPYGNVPCWEDYESLVLIASSTGVAFPLSVMDYLEQLCFLNKQQWKVKTITFVWAERHIDPHLVEMVGDLLLRYSTVLRESGIQLEAEFYFTCPHSENGIEMANYDPFAHLRMEKPEVMLNKPALRIRNPEEIYEEWQREAELGELELMETDPVMDTGDWQSFESDDASEISTLVDDFSDDEEEEEDSFINAYAKTEERPTRQQMPPPVPQKRERSRSLEGEKPTGCQCSLIQHQKRKLQVRSPPEGLTRRHYATRPDLQHILKESIPRIGVESTMVAVCANENIYNDARRAIAKLNIDFALGKRSTQVELYTEAH